VAGIPGDWARLAVCASSLAFDDCNPIERIDLDSVGAALAPAVNVPPEGPGPVAAFDCNEEPCSLAVFVNDQDLVASTPVTFAPSPVISITPGAGLLEGQSVTVSVNNLTPGASYAIFGCGAGCEPPIDVTASAEGVATTTATVSQVAGVSYCRSNCQFALWADGLFVAKAYAMAEGSVAASPATGLADGDTVHVAGTDLMPTYDGPNLGPFPTGDWALVQCDAALADAPSLYAAFDRCAPPPNAAAVTVTGSTLDADLPVASSFTSFLGREVDCTTGPGACVIGLYRFDMDAQSSAWLTPITFATA